MVDSLLVVAAASSNIFAASSSPSVASSHCDSLVAVFEGLECKSVVGRDEIP